MGNRQVFFFASLPQSNLNIYATWLHCAIKPSGCLSPLTCNASKKNSSSYRFNRSRPQWPEITVKTWKQNKTLHLSNIFQACRRDDWRRTRRSAPYVKGELLRGRRWQRGLEEHHSETDNFAHVHSGTNVHAWYFTEMLGPTTPAELFPPSLIFTVADARWPTFAVVPPWALVWLL